jgi:hypothetical protein
MAPCRIAEAIIGHADLTIGARVREVLEAQLTVGGGRFRAESALPPPARHVAMREPGELALAESRSSCDPSRSDATNRTRSCVEKGLSSSERMMTRRSPSP